MPRPSVNISLTNGGLNLQSPSEFGTSGLLVACPAAPTSGYGAVILIRNIAEAKTQFSQAGNADVLASIVKGFYGQTPEGTKLYVKAFAPTTTLVAMAAQNAANSLLAAANGDIRLLAIMKQPVNGYTPSVGNGFDEDVLDATETAQELADVWLGKKMPFRVLLQGYGFTNASDALDFSESTRRWVGIVVGNMLSVLFSTMVVLGRAAGIEPNQNIGRRKSGSLVLPSNAVISIGNTPLDNINASDLETLHAKRYITFERNQIAAGYVLNDDNMLMPLSDDYNNLRYGRTIDNAVRIAFATYYRELLDDVDVDDDGRIATVVEVALATAIESAIDAGIRGQLSKKPNGSADVTCLVNPSPVQYAALYAQAGITNPNFNNLQSGIVYLFVQLKPKGCLKYLNVYLGFTSNPA